MTKSAGESPSFLGGKDEAGSGGSGPRAARKRRAACRASRSVDRRIIGPPGPCRGPGTRPGPECGPGPRRAEPGHARAWPSSHIRPGSRSDPVRCKGRASEPLWVAALAGGRRVRRWRAGRRPPAMSGATGWRRVRPPPTTPPTTTPPHPRTPTLPSSPPFLLGLPASVSRRGRVLATQSTFRTRFPAPSPPIPLPIAPRPGGEGGGGGAGRRRRRWVGGVQCVFAETHESSLSFTR